MVELPAKACLLRDRYQSVVGLRFAIKDIPDHGISGQRLAARKVFADLTARAPGDQVP
jgi:hypothetical protein